HSPPQTAVALSSAGADSADVAPPAPFIGAREPSTAAKTQVLIPIHYRGDPLSAPPAAPPPARPAHRGLPREAAPRGRTPQGGSRAASVIPRSLRALAQVSRRLCISRTPFSGRSRARTRPSRSP